MFTKMPAALEMVDYVTCFANTNPYDIICQSKPDDEVGIPRRIPHV